MLLTLVLNRVLAGVNPCDYFVDVINKIASDWPASRADEFLPRAWLKAQEAEEELRRNSSSARL